MQQEEEVSSKEANLRLSKRVMLEGQTNASGLLLLFSRELVCKSPLVYWHGMDTAGLQSVIKAVTYLMH